MTKRSDVQARAYKALGKYSYTQTIQWPNVETNTPHTPQTTYHQKQTIQNSPIGEVSSNDTN